MKKISIASFALTASTSFALIGPTPPGGFDLKTYCLNKYENANGAIMVGTCSETHNNELRHLPLNSEGCADGQVAMHVSKPKKQKSFSPNIVSCLPPNVAQL
jgi:hypothetical protein